MFYAQNRQLHEHPLIYTSPIDGHRPCACAIIQLAGTTKQLSYPSVIKSRMEHERIETYSTVLTSKKSKNQVQKTKSTRRYHFTKNSKIQ